MIDEMYLQKAAQYQDGKYVGVNENGDLYKGILCVYNCWLDKIDTLRHPSNPTSHIYWNMVINKNIRVLSSTQ